MKFFIDTADIAAIRELAQTGLLDGVTTNPSLVAKTGREFFEMLRDICAAVPGPVSAEVAAIESEAMIAEGRRLAEVADNITVKVPLTWEGLKACRALSGDGIMVNVTLCFSANQALLAAKAGATFVSPFVGRIDDIAYDGMELIAEIKTLFDNYDELTTQILVASVRSPNHVRQAALIGADVATIPPDVLRSLVKHPLTDIGLENFLKDWNRTGQTIL